MGKPGIPESITRSGDVKYHIGYSSSREIEGNKIDLSLAFNPSHLEAVNPVVVGKTRAAQDLIADKTRSKVLSVLIHGDAAFVGQGSVVENLVMNGLAGYDTGGVIHLIINNQIGFTANPNDSRSTIYASDLAKTIDAPIFHVNGDDVEAVVKIADLITRYRQQFKKDVVIDVVCYRKYGHNELDEPLYTQPLMYSVIKNHPSLEKVYSQQLLAEGSFSKLEYEEMAAKFDEFLNREYEQASSFKVKEADWLKGEWKNIVDGDDKTPKTLLSSQKLRDLSARITSIPVNFTANPKIIRQLEARKKAVEEGKEIDWGNAE
jgi:2-oxoglutarate dehydrogenase E1 component